MYPDLHKGCSTNGKFMNASHSVKHYTLWEIIIVAYLESTKETPVL